MVFAPGAVLAGIAALQAGAPILCDAKMVVERRHPGAFAARQRVICTLDDPTVPALAANWEPRARRRRWSCGATNLAAPWSRSATRRRRCSGCWNCSMPACRRPACVIGMPVGFVGAAEAKAALIADGRVPCLVVRGRLGGSAMTAATINALASARE